MTPDEARMLIREVTSNMAITAKTIPDKEDVGTSREAAHYMDVVSNLRRLCLDLEDASDDLHDALES